MYFACGRSMNHGTRGWTVVASLQGSSQLSLPPGIRTLCSPSPKHAHTLTVGLREQHHVPEMMYVTSEIRLLKRLRLSSWSLSPSPSLG